MKKGFSLSEILITLAVIGVLVAVTVPMITVQKAMSEMDSSTLSCVKKELAADLESPNCTNAINKAATGVSKALSGLRFFINSGTANQNLAARKVLYTACSNGGEKACTLLVQTCQRDYNMCDIVSGDPDTDTYDLKEYMDMLVAESNDSQKFTIADIAKPIYDSNNTNIVALVDARSCQTGYNIAAYIKGCTICEGLTSSGAPDPISNADADYSIETGWTLINSAVTATNTTTYTPATATIATLAWPAITGTSNTSFAYGGDIFTTSPSWAKTYVDDQYWGNNSSFIATDGTYLYHIFYHGVIAKIDMQSGALVAYNCYYQPVPDDVYRFSSMVIEGDYIYAVGNFSNESNLAVIKIKKSDLSVVSGFPTLYTESTERYVGNCISKILISGNHIYFVGTTLLGGEYPFYGSVNKTTGAVEWVKSTSLVAGYQWNADLAIDTSGNLYLSFLYQPAGQRRQMYIVKINPNNVDSTNSGIVWSKKVSNTTFFDSGYTSSLFAFNIGTQRDMNRTTNATMIQDGKLYITTSSKYATEADSYGNTGIRKLELWRIDLAKADADNVNSVDWVKAYAMQYSTNPGGADQVYPISLTSDGKNFYILADFTPTAANYRNQIVLALNSNGNYLWQRTWKTASYQSYSNGMIYYDDALYGKILTTTSDSGKQNPTLFKIGSSSSLSGCNPP